MTSLTEAAYLQIDHMVSIDDLQRNTSADITDEDRRRFSQYFTPLSVARFMATMIPEAQPPVVRLLDAGAGVGTLFAAAVNELCLRPVKPGQICVSAYEIDERLAQQAQKALQWCEWRCVQESIRFEGEIRTADFIESAAVGLQGDLFGESRLESFNLAILNPPYQKIGTDSRERRMLGRVGIEETNLYTAFLALALDLLDTNGVLVAITPRSFCNGSYFKRFRRRLSRQVAIQRIHVFDARDVAFSRDSVLQETVILSAKKAAAGDVRASALVSSSAEIDGSGSLIQQVAYDKIIKPHDAAATIHIPLDGLGLHVMSLVERLPCTLDDLGLAVSTGRVVEFRARNHLRSALEAGCAPLIAARHLLDGRVVWPRPRPSKPEALHINEVTASQIVPIGTYTLVKRMTAKEEKRRVVAAVYEAQPGVASVAFENHINFFHDHGAGLEPDLAYGLSAYLNSTLVDSYVRQFNGHTQINATDMRALRYPTASELREIGQVARQRGQSQTAVDHAIQELLTSMSEPSEIDPILAKRRIDEAIDALRQLGFPHAQQNDRSALTLLALLDLPPDRPWSMASAPLRGVTQLMDFFSHNYGKTYAPNTRETVRRQTLHQFVDLALARINPDNPGRPTNSGQTVYQIEENSLATLRTFGGSD